MMLSHRAFLVAAGSEFATLPNPGGVRNVLPSTLLRRIFVLGYAIDSLAANGYAEEAKPIARAMLAGAVSLKLLVCDDLRGSAGPEAANLESVGTERTLIQKECDCRAVAYLTYASVIRRRQNKSFVEHGLAPRERIAQVDEEVDAEDARTLAEHVGAGMEPHYLGASASTWHGLSEEQAATRAGVGDWYARYYRVFSEEAHLSVAAIRRELDAHSAVRPISSEAAFEDPYPVFRASADGIGGALLSLGRHLGVDRQGVTLQMVKPLVDALAAHESAMNPVAFRRMFVG